MTMIIEYVVNVFHNAYHAGNSRQRQNKSEKVGEYEVGTAMFGLVSVCLVKD